MWLSASIQLNQLFRQRQVWLKGLHRDQHRRMTVPDENKECFVPVFGQVVSPVAVRNRFFMNIPNRCGNIGAERHGCTQRSRLDHKMLRTGPDTYVASKYATSSMSSVETEQAGIRLLMSSNILSRCRRSHISPWCFAAEQNVNSVVLLTLRLRASIVH